MAKRKVLFIAAAPLLLLLGMMLSFRILSELPSPTPDGIPERAEIDKPAPTMLPADAATQKALESAVHGQLSAIRKGDYAAALTFSNSSFRNSWNPKRFQEMVETRYKEMTESKTEQFETGRVAEEAANLRVVVTLPDHSRIGYIYNLTRDEDGWHVQACSPGYPIGAAADSVEGRPFPRDDYGPRPPMTPKM